MISEDLIDAYRDLESLKLDQYTTYVQLLDQDPLRTADLLSKVLVVEDQEK